jgi:hypothetical protein
MPRSLVTLAAALMILSLASLVSAQAGGASSAPSKYNATYRANLHQAGNYRPIEQVSVGITEFSSSSATKSSVSKR